MTDVSYSVPEVHCAACEASIRRSLESLPGVAELAVDLERKRLSVRFDEARTDAAAIRERVERAGFDVE